jgi:hypothetical protein
VIQILRLGEFNSHSLYIPPVLASSRCQRINVSLYYYLKGIFIFLLSILRWKYAVWRSTSVVYKKLVWDLIGMCNVTSRNSINLKCKSLWNEAPFNRLVKRVWRRCCDRNGARETYTQNTMVLLTLATLIEAQVLFGFLVCTVSPYSQNLLQSRGP